MRRPITTMYVAVLFAGSLALSTAGAAADVPTDLRTFETNKSFAALVESLDAAIEANAFAVVTRASASAGAAKRGITIPGNMVVGVFRNDYAVRMLEASVPAGIEAPIRFYLTENANGTATLRYRPPSMVFAPYGSAALNELADELDIIFETIADAATGR